MNSRALRLPALVLALAATAFLATASEPPPNTLTAEEKAGGWRLLFDGQTPTAWRAFKKSEFPAQGWAVVDGTLRHLPKGGGGDIVTVEKFNDYEFAFEWWVNAGGNGGVKYFITEERPSAIGHEYQLLGERNLAEVTRDRRHATGSFYEVIPVASDLPLRPPETWNQSRIVVRGQRVEHWLNGSKVVSYELGSEEVKQGIATSKFKNISGFGTKFPHHLLLQDHGGDVRFRNLKIRPL